MIELEVNRALFNIPPNKRQGVLNQYIIGDLNTVANAVQEQAEQVTDYFTPATGQTVFLLSHIPSEPSQAEFYLNGQLQKNGTDYTITSNTITFLNNDFIIQSWYTVTVIYNS